ncbi:hypothetical protein SEA_SPARKLEGODDESS_256 [Streptomyces phage SparkleGoddess]|uniref:Uncharacterized protein n=1 Tax=Streptomyces phage SparkleGoddess TaxID=2283305 RepID=A0A345MEF4_9CAUD|nr:hypothetical protein SEA_SPARKLEGODDESS_256 [Streptomyces phage SparkleGoddess]
MDASEKQIAFIRSLIGQKYSPESAAGHIANLDAHGISKRDASVMIETLKSLPPYMSPEEKARREAITEGFYRVGDDFIRVKVSRSSGNPYGMLLNKQTHKFEYAPGILRGVNPDNRLTLEDAAEYGINSGWCLICSKELTKEESIKRGIGPVCAKKL